MHFGVEMCGEAVPFVQEGYTLFYISLAQICHSGCGSAREHPVDKGLHIYIYV